MTMPETTVNEDDLFSRWKHEVGAARKILCAKSEPKTHAMDN